MRRAYDARAVPGYGPVTSRITPSAAWHHRRVLPAEALALAPDPELARVALERVGVHLAARAALEDPRVYAAAVRLLGFSTAAADFFARHPAEVAALEAAERPSRARSEAELLADVDARGPLDGLRIFRRRSMIRIAGRDLAGTSLDDVVDEISAIAEVCLDVACRLAAPDLRLAVIGLGKLGGRELNYASDIDVLFVHEHGAHVAAERAAGQLIRSLSQPTEEGIALRVDPTLRPGGRSGALSRSLEATLEYYEHGSAVWERQALIKARAVAGDPWLGSAFVEGVIPFVYPVELEPEAIDEVRRTKVRLEEYIRQRGKELTEVKRGRGGIRDVEFAVQLLQIVHGRRDPRLRSQSTLVALRSLAEEGYVAESDADALAGAYRFLRTLEHRLQIVRDLQTHDLPADPHARRTLARSLGFAGAAELQAAYDEQTGLVRGIHERLFYRPLMEAFAGPAPPSPGHDRKATEELLAGLGFADPSRSYEALARLVSGPRRIAKVLSHVFPLMVPALALAADPDAALVRLERVADAVGDSAAPADALADDPGAARRLAYVTAVSRSATDLLAAEPSRVLALADGSRTPDAHADFVRVVARYASRELAPREVGAAISNVADRVVRAAIDDARPGLPFAVIGMGKLGARELNFASDLDLLFVYEGEGAGDLRLASEVGEMVMRSIRDAGWEPDADLRPEGRNGPLARSIAGFLEYWQRYGESWELQSLLRTRAVAGDPDLGRRFELNAADLAYPPDGLTVDRVAEIRRMRDRMERERVRPPEAGRFHFKLGRGSLADVQFAAEVSLMRFGGTISEIRTRGTLDALERLAEHRLVEDRVARDLGEAFVFLSEVKNALEVDRRLHSESIPADPDEQTVLARRLGYETYPRQSFIDDYLRITRRCRRAMERVFHEDA
jgi:glutamate-ammonia-ligase adenylyltransferase